MAWHPSSGDEGCAVLSFALKGSNIQRRRKEIQDLLDTLAFFGQLV